jgi:hypothetical protein
MIRFNYNSRVFEICFENCTGLMEPDTELRDNTCHINEVNNDSEKSLQALS